MKKLAIGVLLSFASVAAFAAEKATTPQTTAAKTAASTSATSQPKDIRVTVNGMVCGFCAQGITKKFKAEPSVSKVDVSLEKKIVTISLKEGSDIPDEKITTLLKDAGYSVEKIERAL